MRKKIPYNTKLPVKFTLAERDLIRNHTFYHPDFANLAALEGKQIRVDMSLEDIEELQGYVTAEANHTPNSNLQTKPTESLTNFRSSSTHTMIRNE